MLNNFIGGGQVFLHKMRMFSQVFLRTLNISLLFGLLISTLLYWSDLKRLDWNGFISYRKAVLTLSWDEAVNDIRSSLGKEPNHVTYLNARSGNRVWEDMDPQIIQHMYVFKKADERTWMLGGSMLLMASMAASICFAMVFLIWSRLGNRLKSDKRKEGSGSVLTPRQVHATLKSLKKCSSYKIGKMTLVKDMETRHFLITGSTGSGKTNLIHNLLPQIEEQKQPAIIIDQTGEMIAKYYNPERGDIIFNPFDQRGKNWDFWTDCSNSEDLERFSKILMSFQRRQSGSHTDPFWENSAEVVFNSCVEYLRLKSASIEELTAMVCSGDLKYLQHTLRGSPATRYLSDDGRHTASSILSVLATNAKPLGYLRSGNNSISNSDMEYFNSSKDNNNSFSLKQHFSNIKQGSNAILFLAAKPSSRALTLPLLACLTELALIQLIDIGIDKKRKLWVIIDELASLGRLPALAPLMTEGRKYGACVVAGLQSLNQLYESYGRYAGSTIFGQFGTSFFFRNTEPEIGRMVSLMCGNEIITRHQKNTSFGANSFRDGVSYNEQEQRKPLVDVDALASLAVGECYTLLPLPSVRLSKMQTPKVHVKDKHLGFIQREERQSTAAQARKNVTEDNPMTAIEDEDIEAGSDYPGSEDDVDVNVVNNTGTCITTDPNSEASGTKKEQVKKLEQKVEMSI